MLLAILLAWVTVSAIFCRQDMNKAAIIIILTQKIGNIIDIQGAAILLFLWVILFMDLRRASELWGGRIFLGIGLSVGRWIIIVLGWWNNLLVLNEGWDEDTFYIVVALSATIYSYFWWLRVQFDWYYGNYGPHISGKGFSRDNNSNHGEFNILKSFGKGNKYY